jgi:hypothetical protein
MKEEDGRRSMNNEEEPVMARPYKKVKMKAFKNVANEAYLTYVD